MYLIFTLGMPECIAHARGSPRVSLQVQNLSGQSCVPLPECQITRQQVRLQFQKQLEGDSLCTLQGGEMVKGENRRADSGIYDR